MITAHERPISRMDAPMAKRKSTNPVAPVGSRKPRKQPLAISAIQDQLRRITEAVSDIEGTLQKSKRFKLDELEFDGINEGERALILLHSFADHIADAYRKVERERGA